MHPTAQLILLSMLIATSLTIQFWVLSTFDPSLNENYNDRNLQLGLAALSILLFAWMLITLMYGFNQYIRKRKRSK